MKPIQYLSGDVTRPQGDGNIIVAHICNDVGCFDAGVAAAIADRWSKAKVAYIRWYQTRFNNSWNGVSTSNDFGLGKVQLKRVERHVWVANMIAQSGLKSSHNRVPIRYDALEECLKRVRREVKSLHASAHMPRIGTGYAGGTWEEIEPIIIKTLCKSDISVVVYNFE